MSKFELIPNKPHKLEIEKGKYITIDRIIPNLNSISQLGIPIKLEFSKSNGITFTDIINPMSYVSIYEKTVQTHSPINYIIRHDDDCSIIIEVASTYPDYENIKLTVEFSSHDYVIDKLKIYITEQIDGVIYAVDSEDKAMLKSAFGKDSLPTANLLVPKDVGMSFQSIYGQIEKHLLPMVLGLNSFQIKKIRTIAFLDSETDEVIYSL